ncbi:MAG: helix-turn-helix transcriptional regulator [Oscillospiraceae bacterium]|nr:helix-turn-helix transcriptional regulator [Clostridia bacterium]MBQ9750580.1 helix-turn-helix transcriptional regulator [Clostridia bacterium]MBR3848085.1 helix-turn-helix transcriptional regulator [Oscillospiraceae bacterium]
MTLGKIIKEYREKNHLSQRQFALTCDVSNGYISMLEEGRNPKTNEPIVPSLATMKKLAKAMGMSLNDLMSQVDDMEISLSEKRTPADKISGRTVEFVTLFEKLTAEQQALIVSQIKGILSNQ